jgi:hypothetical protein
MKIAVRHVYIIVGAILVALPFTAVVSDSRAVPKRPGSVSRASQKPEGSVVPSRYDRLLARYLDKDHVKAMDALSKAWQERSSAEYRERIASYRQREMEIAGSEASASERLQGQAKQRGRKLLDDAFPSSEDYVWRVLIPTSSTSARIFSDLMRKQLVDEYQLVGVLRRDAEVLSDEWIAVIQDIAQRAAAGSTTWVEASFILYRVEALKEKYRPTLERLAREQANDTALDLLFFERDRQTGQRRVVITPENDALMRDLAASPHPGIRVVCADFAAETGNLPLAESVCAELLSTPYQGLANPNATPSQEDRILARARERAMSILFAKVRNEGAFRLVFDISALPQSQFASKEEDTRGHKTWVRADAYVLMRMEIEQARSLMRSLEDHQKDKGQ